MQKSNVRDFTRRALIWLLVLVMVLSLLPMPQASAANATYTYIGSGNQPQAGKSYLVSVDTSSGEDTVFRPMHLSDKTKLTISSNRTITCDTDNAVTLIAATGQTGNWYFQRSDGKYVAYSSSAAYKFAFVDSISLAATNIPADSRHTFLLLVSGIWTAG